MYNAIYIWIYSESLNRTAKTKKKICISSCHRENNLFTFQCIIMFNDRVNFHRKMIYRMISMFACQCAHAQWLVIVCTLSLVLFASYEWMTAQQYCLLFMFIFLFDQRAKMHTKSNKHDRRDTYLPYTYCIAIYSLNRCGEEFVKCFVVLSLKALRHIIIGRNIVCPLHYSDNVLMHAKITTAFFSLTF